ncbi:hypothetical protein LUZ60_013438 [Juncus effusus]|nr:hypothetical protein LUZ60_013438 [Juncus effusus]
MATRTGFVLLRKVRSLHSLSLLSPTTSQASTCASSSTTIYTFSPFSRAKTLNPSSPFGHLFSPRHYATYESVNVVLSDGKPKFEINEVEPSGERKYLSKKRLKMKRKREKEKRKAANKNNPGRIKPKGKKRKEKFPTAEGRIKYKLEKAKMKEAILLEKLKNYSIPQTQGPKVKPEELTGEERFYLKKMAQKKSNYVPIGKRGVFSGVILNMHLHWKKHETVRVVCRPCLPGQIDEYARELKRLSGGVPIQVVGSDTVVFYRGRNYVQPEVMSPVDTLSKKKALEKSKYEESLRTVRRFIAMAEKELEIYYRHVALYGEPQSRNRDLVYGDERENPPLSRVRNGEEKEQEDDPSIMLSDSCLESEFSLSDEDKESDFELELDEREKEMISQIERECEEV